MAELVEDEDLGGILLLFPICSSEDSGTIAAASASCRGDGAVAIVSLRMGLMVVAFDARTAGLAEVPIADACDEGGGACTDGYGRSKGVSNQRCPCFVRCFTTLRAT